MGFVEIENAGKQALEQFPVIKRLAKRVYQLVSYATSNEKFISKGDLIRVSPEDGYEYFYGYYDKSPWDATDRYMIAVKVKKTYKSVAPKEPGIVVLIDTKKDNKVYKIGATHSWNVQQSCLAQWMGPDFKSRIIYNDFRDGKHCSVIYNLKMKAEEKVLPLPVYDVARDGSFALSLDFSRLHRMRPGYGYSNLPDKTKGVLCPDETCIWKMEIDTGAVMELFKYTDFAAFEPDATMIGAEHKVNHLMISPNGKRYMVLHRWFQKGRKHTRLVTVNVDNTEMYNLSDEVFVSHCYWKNDSEILSFLRKKQTGNHYYLLKDKTQEYRMYWQELNTDGHCSYSPDGNFIITDTYPNRNRLASVYLCTEEDNCSRRIAQLFSPFRYDNYCRCDLHPRWNRKGNKICIDSVHKGKRGIYVIPIIDAEDRKVNYESTSIPTDEQRDIIIKLEPYEYISFDIFDTLIFRDVPSPDYVFMLMEQMIKKEIGFSISNFRKKRIKAEKLIRSQKTTGEVTLKEIYGNLGTNIDFIKILDIIALEEKIELLVAHRNENMFMVYNWCLSQKKYIILTSDMYLPESFVKKLLDKCGYDGYDKLFVSSVYQERKANNGKLFDSVLSELGIESRQMVHIGDSEKSDGQMPCKVGCASIVTKPQDRTQYFRNIKFDNDNDRIGYEILKAFCNNRNLNIRDSFESFGYEAFGPLLVYFCRWFHEKLRMHNIKKVYFFARDGLIIKKVYDVLYKDDEVQSFYLEVSRRSLRVPQLWFSPDYEDVIKTFSAATLQNIVSFFDNLGLTINDYKKELEEIGIPEYYTFKKKEMANNTKLRRLYETIQRDVVANSKKEYAALLVHLNANQFEGDVAVVDIGWRGSMQKFLQKICEQAGINQNMRGYYIGLASGAKENAEEVNLTFEGYVFDCNARPDDKDLRKPFVGLIETLFIAQTGSCKNYVLCEDGSVTVTNYSNEYMDRDGRLTPDARKVMNIQRGAVIFAEDYLGSILEKINISAIVAFGNIYMVGVNPSKEQLTQFGDMEFRDGEVLKLAAPKPVYQYIMKPKNIVKDLYNSRWKIGFLKRLFIIPLPYEKMYELMKRM